MIGNNIVLPSKGILYVGNNKLAGGKLEVFPMKTKQEELLAGRSEMISIINKLILACVPGIKEAGISPLDLLSGDRLFLLFMIRKFTYGPLYGFKIKCPGCDLAFRKEITIPDSLYINELKDGDTEPFEAILENKEKTKIGFRLLTGHDEVEIDRYRTLSFKRGGVDGGDPSYTYTIARHIVSINGEPVDPRQAKEFVDEMEGMDSSILQEAIRDKEPGVSRELEFECPQCGFDIDTLMPYTSEFFRPKLRRGRENLRAEISNS